MGEYKCSRCGSIEFCECNTSGYGFCPECSKIVSAVLGDIPTSGHIDELPDYLNPLKVLEKNGITFKKSN